MTAVRTTAYGVHAGSTTQSSTTPAITAVTRPRTPIATAIIRAASPASRVENRRFTRGFAYATGRPISRAISASAAIRFSSGG